MLALVALSSSGDANVVAAVDLTSPGTIAGLVVLYVLYRFNRASRRKADAAYWAGRKRDEERKRGDPDMAGPADDDA